MTDTATTRSKGLSAHCPMTSLNMSAVPESARNFVNRIAPMPTKKSCAVVAIASLERVDESFDGQLSLDEADQRGEEGADGAALGGRDHAGIEAAHHADDEDEDRPYSRKRIPAFAPERRAIGKRDLRGKRRIDRAAHHDHDHVDRGG